MTVSDLITRVPLVARSAAVPRPTLHRSRVAELGVTAAIPLVLLLSWTLGDALQPARYSPVHQTISVAAGHAGTDRWVATAGLLAVGVGYLVSAALLDLSPRGRAGFAFTGICGLGVALFPEAADGPTTGHQVASVVGALALALGPLCTSRRRDAWQRPTGRPLALLATAVFVALNVWLVYELITGGVDGLAERITSNLEVTWPFVVAAGTARSMTKRSRSSVGAGAANR